MSSLEAKIITGTDRSLPALYFAYHTLCFFRRSKAGAMAIEARQRDGNNGQQADQQILAHGILDKFQVARLA